jgi:DNA-binding response OmpR family regulator
MVQSRRRPNCKILIVDDEPEILKSVSYILSREGFVVQSAGSAEAALAAVESETPDILLTDVQMSGSDGLELITTLRKRSQTFPILAMTGAAKHETLAFARKLGADAAIRKPFQKAELVDLIDYCLERAPGSKDRPTTV